ncbi:MAG: spore maturation protein [Clostridia bacterium]|nr:spore maturation protein [Clostridia bacterium]
MPLFIAIFVTAGLVKRVGVYDCFTEGAKEGAESMLGIIAPLVGLMVAINMLRESGALELIARLLSPVLNFVGIPAEVLPLALLRPISGSASLAIVTDIFRMSGPDSLAGKIASVMMGSTETTFYTIAVYFGAVGIKNTRHTLPAALSADLTGILLSAIVARLMLG